MERTDIDKKYDVATAKNEGKGVATIWLQDKEGNEAVAVAYHRS
ncbi:hypothetical protein [Arcticibacter sp.]